MRKSKEVQKVLVLVVLFILGISLSSVLNSQKLIKAEENEGVKAVFYVLNAGSERPGTLEASRSQKLKYTKVGEGKLYVGEALFNDDKKVASNIMQEADTSSLLSRNQKVIWYKIGKEWDGWHVDGEIVEREKENATFYLANRSMVLGTTNVGITYTKLGIGALYEPEKINNNNELIEQKLAVIPDSSTILKENEKIVWYKIGKEWDGWHVDGMIVMDETKSNTYIVDTVQKMKMMSDVRAGEWVTVKGYYEPGDGGAGTYLIANNYLTDNGGKIIKLNNGLKAVLQVKDNRISVKQYGAKGDGITDDTQAINQAVNSGVSTVYIPSGEYRVKDAIDINTSDICILGDNANSVLFTDNDYRKNATTIYDAVLNIVSAKNISISGIKMEARETKKVGYIVQFSIRYASNIRISSCEFIIPETVLSDETEDVRAKVTYCNGDVFTAWHNVIIENCKFEQLSDTNYGGVIGFRDIYKKGCDGAVFRNNTCVYDGHDEMIAIVSSTSSKVENVQILDNEIKIEENKNSRTRTMCFTVGYDDNYIVDNILFEGNRIEGVADFAFMTFGNATNVIIRKNEIKFNAIKNTLQPFLFSCTVPTEKSNIIIRENNIYVPCYNNLTIGGIASGYITMLNNEIVVDAAVASSAFGNNTKINNNNIVLNNTVVLVGSKLIEFSENHLQINGPLKNMFQFYNYIFKTNVNINKNTIEYTFDGGEGETIFMFNGTNMGSYSLTFLDNEIKNNTALKEKNICFISKDASIDKFICENNVWSSFTKVINCNPDLISENLISQ